MDAATSVIRRPVKTTGIAGRQIKKPLAVVTSVVALGFAAGAGDAAVTVNTTIHSEFVFFDPCA